MPDLDDIGCMSHGLRTQAKALYEIWMRMPARRGEFGEQEIRDIGQSLVHIAAIIRGMEKANRQAAA